MYYTITHPLLIENTKMTLYEFNTLNDVEKAEAVWEGALIGDRSDKRYNILLYQIDNFYSEVYYDKKRNAIKRIKSFSSTDRLTPYLEKIDLDIKFDK